MSDPAAVRLVRCPKCQNLLPELTGYSVYQCGGCGAVLRANNENVEADTLSEKSDEERVGGVSDKFSEKLDIPEKRMMNLSDGVENDVKSNGSSTNRAEKKEILSDVAEKYGKGMMIEADKCVIENDLEMDNNVNELGLAKMAKEFGDLKPPNWNSNANGPRRSGRSLDLRTRERDEMDRFQSTRIGVGDLRQSTSKYLEEGPLNYQLGSTYGYGEPINNMNDLDGFNRVEYLEQDRAELLRKLDELKDQISRTCDVVEKPREKFPLDPRVGHHDPYDGSEKWFPNGSSEFNRTSNKHMARPYNNQYAEPSPFTNRNEMAMHGFYPPVYNLNPVQGFGDPFRSQMLRRAPFERLPSQPYYSRQYMDNDMANTNPFDSYPHNINLHPPSCSCFHCYNKEQQVPPPVPNNSMLYHLDKPCEFGPRGYNPRFSNPPPLNSHNPQLQNRWPSDLNSEVCGGIVRHRPQRVVLVSNERRCLPVAGGAPFVTCYNCFELLKLPNKMFLVEKNQKKMRCAACSTIIFFTVANMKLVVSGHSEAKTTPTKANDSSNMAVNMGSSYTHGNAKWASSDFSSDEYDNSGYDFQSMDRKLVSSPTGHDLGSNKSAAMRSMRSTPSCTSEDEGSSGSLVATGKKADSAELATKTIPSPPPQGSPLQDHIDYSNKYNVLNRLGKGSRSGRSEREKVIPKKATSRTNSMKDLAMATEIEIPSNEYSNTGASQDSGDGTREEEQVRLNKGSESSFVGIIKKSLREFSRSNQAAEQGKANVKVNGQPLQGRLVKKAEKLAGPIQPGEYWYDFRAGFWGVMGRPCQGIIPPFIEEFNYPMPENCAAGNTGVFVNGRELNQEDLDLLGSRGLPTDRDRSYILEISGRVLDEDSGEELDSLGKLAPTVEKVKHGFGMKVRRAAA